MQRQWNDRLMLGRLGHKRIRQQRHRRLRPEGRECCVLLLELVLDLSLQQVLLAARPQIPTMKAIFVHGIGYGVTGRNCP
jgi:hypothetical protein